MQGIVLWCNGSTTDSGPVCLGSNPSRTTYSRFLVKRRREFFYVKGYAKRYPFVSLYIRKMIRSPNCLQRSLRRLFSSLSCRSSVIVSSSFLDSLICCCTCLISSWICASFRAYSSWGTTKSNRSLSGSIV